MRGLSNVREQCLLAATAQNIKKIALLLSRMGPNMPPSTLPALLDAYIALCNQYCHLLAEPTKNN